MAGPLGFPIVPDISIQNFRKRRAPLLPLLLSLMTAAPDLPDSQASGQLVLRVQLALRRALAHQQGRRGQPLPASRSWVGRWPSAQGSAWPWCTAHAQPYYIRSACPQKQCQVSGRISTAKPWLVDCLQTLQARPSLELHIGTARLPMARADC